MSNSSQNGLYDFIRERFIELNELLENLWISFSNKPITLSEWNIIAHIAEEQLLISQLTKRVSISRQATHKLLKQLEGKGIVQTYQTENNKRDKCICLTPFGIQCFKKYIELKNEIEKKIEENIGERDLVLLKNILNKDWGI